MKKKTVALLLAGAMIFGVAAGGTMAWLTASTDEVTNTFSVGDIDIDLKEHKYDADTGKLLKEEVLNNEYYFVPGSTFPKDPFVSVDEKSEDCYLFVKVEELFNSCTVTVGSGEDAKVVKVDPIIDWQALPHVHDSTGEGKLADGWKKYVPENTTGVEYWYRTVLTGDTVREWYLLKDDQVKISTDVIKQMVSEINREDEATGKDKPQLVFNAAAIQLDYLTLQDAWMQLPESFRENYAAPPEESSDS